MADTRELLKYHVFNRMYLKGVRFERGLIERAIQEGLMALNGADMDTGLDIMPALAAVDRVLDEAK